MLLCTNTMHRVAEEVQDAIQIPLLHIVDATAETIKLNGQNNVGLLGTKFTMEQDFYKGRLHHMHSIKVLIPDDAERETIHGILYNELCLGKVKNSSRKVFKGIIERLASRGAEGVILGCTEIPLIVKQVDYQIPLYDTTALHAQAAIALALA